MGTTLAELEADQANVLAAAQRIVDGAKGAARDMTETERAEVQAAVEKANNLKGLIAAKREHDDLVSQVSAMIPEQAKDNGETFAPDGLGGRFLASSGFKGFKKAHPAGLGENSREPIHVKAANLGHLADLGIGRKAAEIVTTTVSPHAGYPTFAPGYRSMLLDQELTFLDLITTGTTTSTHLRYARVVSETNGATIVPEAQLKPQSDVQTDTQDAVAFTYADGFTITNQTLADDGALASFMEGRVAFHVRQAVVDKVLNGTGNNEPTGLMHASGTQAQEFTTDALTTVAAAIQKVQAVMATPQAVVMHPADMWALRLQKDSTGRFLSGDPFGESATPSLWGVPIVMSHRVAQGTALVGDFSGVTLLEREPLAVVAFNQHEDYAARNLVYVRAELRALQMIYTPRDIVVADLAA